MNTPEIQSALNLPFQMAIDFFQKKVNVPAERWDDLWKEQHVKGFMVAGAMKSDLIQDFRNAVKASINDGESLEQFRAKFDQVVKSHGWDYHGSRNWRSRVIWETNIRSAYAAGRWQQMTDPDVVKSRPYLIYRHGDSIQPRALHLSWDKKILPASSPWWETHYPPGGFGCKCKVYSLSERDLKRYGKTGPDKAPDDGTYTVQDRRTGKDEEVPRGIDPGFNYNPGKDPGKAGKVLSNLLGRLDPDIRKQLIQELGKVDVVAKTVSKAVKEVTAIMEDTKIDKDPKTIKEAKALIDGLMDRTDVSESSYQFGVKFRHAKSDLERINGIEQVIAGSALSVKDLDEAKAIIKTLQEVQDEANRLGIPGIRRIRGSETLKSKNGSMGDGVLTLKPGRKIITTPLPEYDASRPSSRTDNPVPWSTSESARDIYPSISTIWHEFAHHIHQQIGRTNRGGMTALEGEINTFRLTLHQSGYQFKYPTQYSRTNSKEYFAETYAMIKAGREDLVDEKMLEFLKGKGFV